MSDKQVGIVRVVAGLLLSVLVGCGGAPSEESPTEAAVVRDTVDSALQQRYQRSCFACHSRGAGGAPRAGDRATWQLRLESKGLDTLVNSVIEGIGSMPPGGLCGQCSVEDYRALILLMAEQ